ncbi:TPA: DUF1902 domain-containing protein [Morganella morganii]|uniref:DUF1902 domain-containing protein n=1 Tax=Morganella morganii TaxID=582 RepID=UPI0037EC59D8
MAYRQDGVYVAACLDLSLAAQGDNIDDAIKKLDAQVKDFIEELKEEPQYAKQLLNRKAPFSMWVKYWILAFKIYFSKKSHKAKLFNEHEPMDANC